jgi:exosortase
VNSSTAYSTFGLLVTVSILIWWKVLLITFSLAWTNDAYTHILLIIPISVTLIILDWKKRSLPPVPNIGGGLVLLGLATAIGIGGLRWGRVDVLTGDVRLALEMLSLDLWWLGAVLFCFGSRVFRDWTFPLFFLFWLIPAPKFVTAWAVEFLQQGTASFARVLLAIFGVPATRDGTALSVPGFVVEVAQECSSIRSSMMLLVSSMLMSYLLLRSFWSRSFVIAVAIPLAIAKNGLRVFTLTLLALYVGPTVFKSELHRQGGILFFGIALAVLFEIVWFAGRLERRCAIASNFKQINDLSAPGLP